MCYLIHTMKNISGSTLQSSTVKANGMDFNSMAHQNRDPIHGFKNHDELYYHMNKSVISRIVLNQTTSTRERSIWIQADQTWRQYSLVPRDYCHTYNFCGANGKCMTVENPICQCLKGFKPKSQENWIRVDWSQVCEHNIPTSYQDKHRDRFAKFVGLKLSENTHTWMKRSIRNARSNA